MVTPLEGMGVVHACTGESGAHVNVNLLQLWTGQYKVVIDGPNVAHGHLFAQHLARLWPRPESNYCTFG